MMNFKMEKIIDYVYICAFALIVIIFTMIALMYN